MSVHLNYYVLSPEGRKRFEDWKNGLGITEGTHFKILENLYIKNTGTIAQICNDTKLSPKDVIAEMEFLEQGGYLMVIKP
ncbi:MAG: hypothetical protein U9N44_05450 [Chloroflexota bacterium]|nr:hypothetical protein [Chloroflexota bacterium]